MKTARLSPNRLQHALAAIFVTLVGIAGVPSGELLGQSGQGLPTYLKDRGIGTPTSMFGTYVEEGQLLVYPFVEHYLDNNAEYAPNEFGLNSDVDYRGRYRATEGLIFLGYGLRDNLVLEVEAAVIGAQLETSPSDRSGIPGEIEESGLGDVQTQIDWLWSRETASRPAFFSYAEVVYPFNKTKALIGTSDWEIKAGTGLVRGFSWGTVTFRAAAEYSRAESKVDIGEVALEYLKRVSPSWRLYAGVEVVLDEVELITEAQWHISPGVIFKFNNAFGVTSKATDWAPEIGFMFSIPTK